MTEHVTSQVVFPAVAFRVPVRLPGDSRGGGSRSRSVLSVAAHRGWFDSATKWAVDVGNGRVAPALSSAPTETPNVRLDSSFIFSLVSCSCPQTAILPSSFGLRLVLSLSLRSAFASPSFISLFL